MTDLNSLIPWHMHFNIVNITNGAFKLRVQETVSQCNILTINYFIECSIEENMSFFILTIVTICVLCCQYYNIWSSITPEGDVLTGGD